VAEYLYADQHSSCAHAYLIPALLRVLEDLNQLNGSKKLFDLGCGNGAVARKLIEAGYQVTGVDPSQEGIRQAAGIPGARLEVGSSEDDLRERYGTFPLVVSLEVVEHVFAPRTFARRAFDLLEPGGTAIISTPYHGYMKNLLLALSGHMDEHFTALWDNGHIKFWSRKTLTRLLEEAGFRDIQFRRVGRIPPLAKSMIAIARKP